MSDKVILFEDWLVDLEAALQKLGGMTPEEAHSYAKLNGWQDYYEDGHSPEEAAFEDLGAMGQ